MLGQLWAKTKIDDPVKRDYPRYQIDPPYFSCQDQQPGVASPALLFAPNASQQASHAALEAAALLHKPSWCVRGFRDYDELRNTYLSDPNLLASVAAIVTFDTTNPSNWSYTMLVSDPPTGSASGPVAAKSRLTWSADPAGPQTAWETDGLLALQWALDRGAAEAHSHGAAEAMIARAGATLYTSKLPTAEFVSNYNPVSEFPKYILSIYSCMGILFSLIFMVNAITGEKEKNLL